MQWPRRREQASLLDKSFNDAGIQTAESCEGGEGHAYKKPTVVLIGGSAVGWRALAVCKDLRFPVRSLERIWFIRDGGLPVRLGT